ncbi:aldo/keto reductase [Cyanobacteria bacterium FACHB-471]|nr:aldo/keto reductase [Cyanobacteria bacterium FACHB-471]
MASSKTTRRNFLITSMIAAGGAVSNGACQQSQTTTTAQVQNDSSSILSEPATSSSTPSAPVEIPQQVLGRTEVNIPILGLGGAGRTPLSRAGEEQEAITIIERALNLGIRYFDTASSYGPSEERLGKVLPSHRANLFLASKTGHRDRDGAWQDLEQSLQRLQTDYLDLWQFHALTYDWDLNTLLDQQQGAIKAAEEARQQGIIRFIGITGHYNPAIIAEGLRRYPFDTALIPVNAADKHTASPFITEVLPTAQQHNTGLIAMKVPAYGRLIETEAVDGMRQAMGYALSQSGVHCCIIAAETVQQLEHNVTVAQTFQPLTSEEMTAIEQRTAADWQNFSFFREWA